MYNCLYNTILHGGILLKKLISILLATAVIFTTAFGLGTGAYAKTGSNGFVTAELDEGEVYFDADYAEIGKTISAFISGREDEEFFYKWYLDNEQINDYENFYTPCKGDLEKLMTVEIYDTDCELVGKKSMLISELPVLYIEVEDRKAIVKKDVQLDAQMTVQGNSEFNDASILYTGATQIKGRGNSTWQADKKPYKLKLDSKTDLFGMGKSKHWVLMSNPYDTSHMRNELSYRLSGDMGIDYQQSVWVDLVLNGEVLGLYQLCEHVRIDDTRVDITDWEDVAEDAAKAIYKKNTDIMTKNERDELIDIMAADLNWVTEDTVTYKGNTFTVSDYFDVPEITGGYLFEVDTHEYTYLTPHNVKFTVDSPEGIGSGMLDYLKDYYNAFEAALFSDDYCTVYNGKRMRYTEFIDVDSFVTGILVNEIFENLDFGSNSTWMSKEIGGKIVYGPVWDMDYTTVSSFNNWTTGKKAWINRMLGDPAFMSILRDKYFEHRYTDILDMLKDGGDIDTFYDEIHSAAVNNDLIWPSQVGFEDNVRDLRWRLQNKINWLDKQFLTLNTALTSVGSSGGKINLDDIYLEINQNSVYFAAFGAEEAVIHINGVPLDKIANPDGFFEYTIPEGTKHGVISASVYYDDGNTVSADYAVFGKDVENIQVTRAPDKLLYEAGEALDLTGLQLTAAYSDGTGSTVEPEAAYTCVDDSLGTQFFAYGKVTEKPGNVYLVLKYKNAETKLAIDVKPRQNFEEVDAMLAQLPEDCSTSGYLIKKLFEAKTAYDALSLTAKSKLKNADRLAAAYAAFGEAAQSTTNSVMGAYADGLFRIGSKENIVICAKGTPKKIGMVFSTGDTLTMSRDHKNIISIKQVGDYELWTVNQMLNGAVEYYDIKATYPGNPPSDYNRITINELQTDGEYIKSVTANNYAVQNETYTVTVNPSEKVSKIRFSENSSVVGTAQNGENYSFAFETVGLHSITLSYFADGVWTDYRTYDVYVREPAAVDTKVFKVDFAEKDYHSDAQIKVVTEINVPAPQLVSDGEVIELTAQEKNGFKIWTGAYPTEKTYTLMVNGEVIAENISSFRLGDVNVDSSINSFDALLVLQHAVGKIELTQDQMRRADMNGDGAYNSYDALKILQVSTGEIN